MCKRLSKYIDFCNYSDKSLIVLSATSGSISIASFASVIATSPGVASASLRLVFSLSTKLIKKLVKTTRSKKKKHNKITILARSELNSIESKISEALINNQISHEDFLTIINEERNYRELKESIKMMKGQEDKKQKQILNKYQTMLSYCLKCKKNTETINPRVSKTSNGKTMMIQSKYAICDGKKSKFVKKQEARGIVSSVVIRPPLSKILVLGDILF